MAKLYCNKCFDLVDMQIVDSRERSDGKSIRRRRKCLCGFKFSTIEVSCLEYKNLTKFKKKWLYDLVTIKKISDKSSGIIKKIEAI